MTNPDNSTYLVPVTVWSKKGSSTPVMETQDDQGSAPPVSANTPQGPAAVTPTSASTAASSLAPQGGAPASSATPQGVPGASANPGARQPGTQPAGSAVKAATPRIPSSSVGTPIPFGGKPNELTKSDTAQYTKLAEDANDKQKVLQNAQGAFADPNRRTSLDLTMAWVRSNVQGAGRMTNTEIQQAASMGSWGDKVKSWISQAQTGRLAPAVEQQMMSDIQRSARTAQSSADTARGLVQEDIGQKTMSSKTPKSPGTWTAPKDAPAPTKPNQVLKANGQVVARSVDGKIWSQP